MKKKTLILMLTVMTVFVLMGLAHAGIIPYPNMLFTVAGIAVFGSITVINDATPNQAMREILASLLKDIGDSRANTCYNPAGLAVGTNAHTLQIANAVDFSIGGVFYHKAITDNIAMTALAQQAVSTYCYYLISINAAGAVAISKGNEAAALVDALLPALPANSAPLGYMLVQTDADTTFTCGTTDITTFTGADGTVTLADMSHMPPATTQTSS